MLPKKRRNWNPCVLLVKPLQRTMGESSKNQTQMAQQFHF